MSNQFESEYWKAWKRSKELKELDPSLWEETAEEREEEFYYQVSEKLQQWEEENADE